ncbi:MAG: hypothetical protein ACJ763_10715 [Bdellovibrionia bacterium]
MRQPSIHQMILAFALIAANSATAAWKQSSLADKEKINQLCHGEGAYNVSTNEFETADIYKNKAATFIVCHQKSESPEYLTSEYILKYNPGSKMKALHMDAEVMTWGTEIKQKEDTLTASLYFPSNKKLRRKIRDFQIDCTGKCQLKDTCVVEHLASDIDPEALIKKIEAQSQTVEQRVEFVFGDHSDSKPLDQLFAEALTGNKKAVNLMNKLDEGLDAAPAEIMGSYLGFLEQLKSKNCHWSK